MKRTESGNAVDGLSGAAGLVGYPPEGWCRTLAVVFVAALTLLAASPARACNTAVSGTDDSDNNSFSFFPIWRGQINGTPGNDDMCAYRGDDLAYGGAGNDLISGGDGNDSLYGEAGSDTLEGGWGDRDSLYGGTGNDSYYVYDSSDSVVEASGAGRDLVISAIDYVLPQHVEDLYLSPNLASTAVLTGGINGTRAVTFRGDCDGHTGPSPCVRLGDSATGNDRDNQIRGNGLDNTLDGRGGHDLLFGGHGDDVLEGGAGNDMLAGFSIDRQWWTHENDYLTGGSGGDVFVIGVSFRSGGLSSREAMPTTERFPQYLGQGMVYILDFDWREGDKIEVWGDIGDYAVELGSNWLGPYAAIYWDGSAEGYGSHELVGWVVGITSSGDLVPSLDFL